MTGLDMLGLLVLELGRSILSAFASAPMTWSAFSLAVVAGMLAAANFAEHKGWRGWGWLGIALALYGVSGLIAPAEMSGAPLGLVPK